MITGKTNSGFEFEIETERLDDWDLLESLTAVDKGNISVIPNVALALLGEEQLQRLKSHVKGIHGRVSMSAMFQEIFEILNSNNQGKN